MTKKNNNVYVPNLVTEIYREVLKLACEGNDVFFSFDSKYKTIQVLGYVGRFTAFCKRKPDINILVNYDELRGLAFLKRKIAETFKPKPIKVEDETESENEDEEETEK